MFKFFKTLGMPEEEKLMHNLKLKYEELCNTEITGSTDEEKKLKQEKIDIVKQELESLHHKIRQSYITTYKKLEDTGIKRLGNGPAIAIMTGILYKDYEFPMSWKVAVPKYKYARNLAPFLLKAVQKKRKKLVQEAIAEMSIKLDYLLANERELNIAYSVGTNKEYCVRIPSENFGLAKAIAAYKKTHVTVYIPN
jgi:hypothetical protein